jgi:ankyrin repeat protein
MMMLTDDEHDGHGGTMLHDAVLKGSLPAFQEASCLSREMLDARDANGNTALHYAAMHNQRDFARILLSNGACANLQSNTEETPLTLAAAAGHKEMVELLIEAGADVNKPCEDSWTCLHILAESKKRYAVDILCYLIDHGANPTSRNSTGQTAADVATNARARSILREAQGAWMGSDNDGVDPSGINVAFPSRSQKPGILHEAVLHGDRTLVRNLLVGGESVCAQDSHGNTPLHYAAYHNMIDILDILLGIRGTGDSNQAAEAGGPDTVLVAMHLRSASGDTPLDFACTLGHLEAVKMLLRAGTNVKATDANGWGPLHNAVMKPTHKGKEIVACLLSAGADPSSRTATGQAPVDVACSDALRSLLARSVSARSGMQRYESQENMQLLDGQDEF